MSATRRLVRRIVGVECSVLIFRKLGCCQSRTGGAPPGVGNPFLGKKTLDVKRNV